MDESIRALERALRSVRKSAERERERGWDDDPCNGCGHDWISHELELERQGFKLISGHCWECRCRRFEDPS